MESTESRVPVTLLAGFLGSGKTTLVNRILSTDHGQRIAVIVNEFADAGIDGQLIDGSDVIELANGCICCSISTDLTDTLITMLRRRNRRFFRGPQFDRVIIEASGMASPGPTVQTLLMVEELAAAYRVEGVVTVAHAQHAPRQIQEHPEAAEQAGYADLILLNHIDQADANQLQTSEEALRACNGAAAIVPTTHAKIDLDRVLSLDSLHHRSWALHAAGTSKPTTHSQGVTTITLRSDRELDYGRFKTWLKFLLGLRRHQVMRLKGVLRCQPYDTAVVVQGIYEWTQIQPGDAEPPAESVLVVIGRDLDHDQIQRGWDAAHPH